MRKRLYMLSVLLIALVQAVLAQVTTSALTGKVTLGNTSESVIGATIQVGTCLQAHVMPQLPMQTAATPFRVCVSADLTPSR